MTETESNQSEKKKSDRFWLVYIALLISGFLLICSAYDIQHLSRWTAQVGITLVFSAFALLMGRGSKSGYSAVAIVWIAVVASFII